MENVGPCFYGREGGVRLIDGRRWAGPSIASKTRFDKERPFPIPFTSSMTKWKFGTSCGTIKYQHQFLMVLSGTPWQFLRFMLCAVFCVTSRCGLMTSLCAWCLDCLTIASPLQESSLAVLRGFVCGQRYSTCWYAYQSRQEAIV